MINPTLFLRSLKGSCYGNRFWARIGENSHTPPSFCALAFHNGWQDHNDDAQVNTANHPSMSDKNIVNFGLVTRVLQARLRRAGYMMGFAMHL